MKDQDTYNRLRLALLAKGWDEHFFNQIVQMDNRDEDLLRINVSNALNNKQYQDLIEVCNTLNINL